MSRLRTVDTSSPGLGRRRRGAGFSYHDECGEPLRDSEAIARIRALAIPPAWRDVWIAPWANGHVQAIGRDAAGRRQYLYHRRWREARDAEKFERMLDFARALPAARRRLAAQLVGDSPGRERVLACAVRLLDRCFLRIGGEEYAEENETFGLATLRRSHVRLEGDTLILSFPGKGGRERRQSLVDPRVCAVVRQLKARRSDGELLAYRDGRRWIDVRSREINDHLRALVGDGFSAKDFRTWHATVLASVAIAILGRDATSERARSLAVIGAIDEVAHYLGNTRAVCRASYVDPRVFEAFRRGDTIEPALAPLLGPALVVGDDALLADAERAVLRLLEQARPGRHGERRQSRTPAARP